jgi:hypothetical protein
MTFTAANKCICNSMADGKTSAANPYSDLVSADISLLVINTYLQHNLFNLAFVPG